MAVTKHGEASLSTRTTEYQIYTGAKNRCDNPKNKSYAHYGQRGIKFLFTSFEYFLDEMGRRPSLKHSLERKDNNGPYSPDNCKWATPDEQARNRSVTVKITANGETKCLIDWAAEKGVGQTTLRQRINYGFCGDCTVNLPLGGKCTHREAVCP